MARGLTLVELLVAMVIVVMLLAIAGYSYTLQFQQILHDIQLANIYTQADYALENIRLHCISSPSLNSTSLFTPGSTNSKGQLCFNGESDIYNITPDNPTDNTNYCYYINARGELALSANNKEEVLIDSKYRPNIEFTYTAGSEPNVLTVKIDAQHKNTVVTKMQAVRFWFTDVVRP